MAVLESKVEDLNFRQFLEELSSHGQTEKAFNIEERVLKHYKGEESRETIMKKNFKEVLFSIKLVPYKMLMKQLAKGMKGVNPELRNRLNGLNRQKFDVWVDPRYLIADDRS